MASVDTLRAGAAQLDLKAHAGLDLSGYAARCNPATGVHDPVFARALALCNDDTLLLILVVDALGFERSFVAAARAQIESALRAQYKQAPGARSIHILLAGTHTHSAPATMTLHGCGEVSEEWLPHCAQALAAVALQAVENLQPARFAAGSAVAEGVAINRRRQPERDDENSPPLDEEVGVWRIENLSGETIAGVVNFACHPVVMTHENREISAEYPGAVCAQLQDEWGGVALFLTGAAGDINPARRGAWSDVEWTASQIAQAVGKAWTELSPQPDQTLQAAAREIVLPLLPPLPRAELQELQDQFSRELNAARQNNDAANANIAATRLRWCESVLNHNGSTPGHAVEVQLFRVGMAALVALPGEVFVELGLQIKARLCAQGFQNVLIAGYANANPGYIPTREAYALGGYEVDSAHCFYGHPACAVPEAGETLVAVAQDLGHDVRHNGSTPVVTGIAGK
jgi:hypothetical protein